MDEMLNNEAVHELVQNMDVALQPNEARLNITVAQQNADLPQPIPFDASDEDILAWATEAVRSGTLPGVPRDERVSFAGFVVQRFKPNEQRAHNLITLRPKTEFGGRRG